MATFVFTFCNLCYYELVCFGTTVNVFYMLFILGAKTRETSLYELLILEALLEGELLLEYIRRPSLGRKSQTSEKFIGTQIELILGVLLHCKR